MIRPFYLVGLAATNTVAELIFDDLRKIGDLGAPGSMFDEDAFATVFPDRRAPGRTLAIVPVRETKVGAVVGAVLGYGLSLAMIMIGMLLGGLNPPGVALGTVVLTIVFAIIGWGVMRHQWHYEVRIVDGRPAGVGLLIAVRCDELHEYHLVDEIFKRHGLEHVTYQQTLPEDYQRKLYR